MVTMFVAMAPTMLAMLAPIERPETLLMALRVSTTTEYVAIVSILENLVFRLHLREHCSWMLYKLQIPPVHGKAQALLATRAPAPIVVAHLAGKRSTASLAPGRPWLRSSVVASRCRRIVRKSRDVLRGTGNLSLEMQPNENEAKTLQIHPADEAMLKVRDRSSHSIARVAPRAMQAYATAPASKLSRQGRPMWCQGKKDRGAPLRGAATKSSQSTKGKRQSGAGAWTGDTELLGPYDDDGDDDDAGNVDDNVSAGNFSCAECVFGASGHFPACPCKLANACAL